MPFRDLMVTMEPKAQNLLLGKFSAQRCQALLPKKPNKAIQAEIKKIHKEIEETKILNPGPVRTTREAALNSACQMMHKQHKTKGLRIDVQITDTHNQHEIWVDTTCIHSTCQSRIRQERKHIQEKIQTREAVRCGKPIDITVNEVGFAVREQTKAKHATYTPLMDIAKKQTMNGARTKKPIFMAVVLSTFGEFGLETVKLQEFLTSAYARKLAREGSRQDGLSTQTLTAQFRNKFRNRMQIAVAKGIGRMINTCGLPATMCKKHQSIRNN